MLHPCVSVYISWCRLHLISKVLSPHKRRTYERESFNCLWEGLREPRSALAELPLKEEWAIRNAQNIVVFITHTGESMCTLDVAMFWWNEAHGRLTKLDVWSGQTAITQFRLLQRLVSFCMNKLKIHAQRNGKNPQNNGKKISA